jgi:hypothetical protein
VVFGFHETPAKAQFRQSITMSVDGCKYRGLRAYGVMREPRESCLSVTPKGEG